MQQATATRSDDTARVEYVPIDVLPINKFLLDNDLRISSNPCVSPDFCLDWKALSDLVQAGAESIHVFTDSGFATGDQDSSTAWRLAQDTITGDHCWLAQEGASAVSLVGMADGIEAIGELSGFAFGHIFPASFANLIALKNLVLAADPTATIFPTATGTLEYQSLGIGARMTELHYPATEWAMAHLQLSLTGNQNSIPRELVYDVNEMLNGTLDQIPFPFIGASIPEGHQGTSVEGMTHCSILSKVKNGFHKHKLPWGFNADHQPIGGKFDHREDQLVRGCIFATYITFDISHELELTHTQEGTAEEVAAWVTQNVPAETLTNVRSKVAEAGVTLDETEFNKLMAYVWPAMLKMKVRDDKYAAARAAAFSTEVGRHYFREMSIDELPGLTSQGTLATILALCFEMGMPVQYVAPAFGWQKNCPYEDGEQLAALIRAAWQVCAHFGVSIGFHSGSGKSRENYELCGEITGSKLEVKTSGRYTYELGRALAKSSNEADQAFWREWYEFTMELAVTSAFAENENERKMARSFIMASVKYDTRDSDDAKPWIDIGGQAVYPGAPTEEEVFASPEACYAALRSIPSGPDPDHMFWFEYNFLFVKAAEGKPDKQMLGDHSPLGYQQRARFYRDISDEGRLKFAQNIVKYIVFLADTTKQVSKELCQKVNEEVMSYTSYQDFLAAIKP